MNPFNSIAEHSFASDNNAGVHPQIMEALLAANRGHVVGYGDDPITARAVKRIRAYFGAETEVFFVYSGTGANILALNAVTHSYESVICAQTAHINVDECGAPEKVIGCKLIDIPTVDGKLTPGNIRPVLTGFDFEHHSQPRVISISQPTELGTVYTPEELRALRRLADEYNLLIHMDGARLANAAAALNGTLADTSVRAGVDVLSFGGTKNGMMFGEAVLFFSPLPTAHVKYLRKQNMQLHSKMRFISCQFEALLRDDLWLVNARHANKMARLLHERLRDIPGVELTQPVETNALFLTLPRKVIETLRAEYFFYDWDEAKNEVRWMCAFDTQPAHVEAFVKRVKELLDG